MFELRDQEATCAAFIDVLAPGGMDVHATDEDVMRVFVPAEAGGDQRAIFTRRREVRRAGPPPAPERADARGRVRQALGEK